MEAKTAKQWNTEAGVGEAENSLVFKLEGLNTLPNMGDLNRAVIAMLEKQAEISFRVGRLEGVKFAQRQFDINLPEIMKTCEQAGARKVVDAINPILEQIDKLANDIRNDWTDPRYECREIGRLVREWQAFVKGEGL